MRAKYNERANTVRLPSGLQKQIERIAKGNHIAVSDVIRLGLFQIIPRMEKEGITIKPGDM